MKYRFEEIEHAFAHLDDIFSKQRSIEEKRKYLEVKKVIISKLNGIKGIVGSDVSKFHDGSEINQIFMSCSVIKDKYFELMSLYLNKKINGNRWIDSNRKGNIKKLSDFFWFESVRNVRNKIAHDMIEPVFVVKGDSLYFNYFHFVDGNHSKVPFVHYNNDEGNLVALKEYGEYLIGCFWRLIFSIHIIVDPVSKQKNDDGILYDPNISNEEDELRKFIALFGYTEKKCLALVSDYESGSYQRVNPYYLAELYLNLGCIRAKNGDISDSIKAFKKSISLNPDIAQVSNIIAACAPDLSDHNLVMELISEYFECAINNKYIRFFGNAGYYFSELEDHEITESTFQAGFGFVNENKESVDYLYNYAHFKKNNIKDYDNAVKLCLMVLDINPVDRGAHKMLLSLYDLQGRYHEIPKHIDKYYMDVNDELKIIMDDWLDAYNKAFKADSQR
ncbi:tetratricopeptide repeat family protein [Vibrio parahaemolyticus VPTS-2010_2]|uniref:tetratricopeptide repeat protein n=1 Tax=Vibrio parahaemolyticus TaxID=670 RepID=UPI0004516584|nr:hypothetical protein [Vibrio parahaemolyticus]EXJ40793.1 tetratricopeptide repeat family protein [Vibrio parahaemolyticus VPTS-2010_2]